jgi:hypothetical protein
MRLFIRMNSHYTRPISERVREVEATKKLKNGNRFTVTAIVNVTLRTGYVAENYTFCIKFN